MKPIPAILIFDVGKTNKKILVFDEQYKIIHEESIRLNEITDEDGFPCEDVHELTQWIKNSFERIISDARFDIMAVNFSGYGASFVCVDSDLQPVLPLSNYLKPFPDSLLEKFHSQYGEKINFSKVTASPVLGNLNSGMQLYRTKQQRPAEFEKVRWTLHLPQYISSVISRKPATEITSVGCHTYLWDFQKKNYHHWVSEEKLIDLFPPLADGRSVVNTSHHQKKIKVGTGLHDSSAALIPYLIKFKEPFILLSTGTWCISLNPFNDNPLTENELEHDCLFYISFDGKNVKASRAFLGHDHDEQVKRLATHFNKAESYFNTLDFSNGLNGTNVPFSNELNTYKNADEAYMSFMNHLVARQCESVELVLYNSKVKKIFVDGGFSQNHVFMKLFTRCFPGIEIFAASVAQASALGAALAIHDSWNENKIPDDLIELQKINPANPEANR